MVSSTMKSFLNSVFRFPELGFRTLAQRFTVLFSVDPRDRSRTMPSRIETRSVAGSYAGGPRSLQPGNGSGGRYFHERPRSVNSNFESGARHGHHGLGPTSISVDQVSILTTFNEQLFVQECLAKLYSTYSLAFYGQRILAKKAPPKMLLKLTSVRICFG